MSKGLNVHSEIGKLKKVVLHRPGRDLVNVKAEEFDDVWIHDCLGVRTISWTAPRRIQASCGTPSGSATRGTS